MDDNLIKARRNLISVSVVLILFGVANISIAKVSVLGTELLVGNPLVVRAFLWVLWGYLLLRYCQFLGAEKDRGLRKAFIVKTTGLLHQKIAERVQKENPTWRVNYADIGYPKLVRSGLSWHQPLFENQPSGTKEVSRHRIPTVGVISAMVLAFVYVGVVTPKATEHILPLLLAFAAPVVTVMT